MSNPGSPQITESVAPSAALALAAAAHDDARDRFIALAAATGDPVSVIADYIGLSRQQIHAILDGERQAPPLDVGAPASSEYALAWRATEQALEAISGGEAFEQLVQVLIADIDPGVRPLGGTGDRARDAIADLADSDDSIFSISIERQWTRKIRREVKRVVDFGHRPRFVYAITNRKTSRQAEDKLEEWAAGMGITLRVLGQRWLVVKLLHPSYLPLREQLLHLAPPRPTVFRDEHAYRRLLNGRTTTLGLDIPRVGDDYLFDQVRDRLDTGGRVIITGPGGVGKSRLLLDVALQARQHERWLFLDDLTPLTPDALGELGGGHELVIVIDNAHRRADLREVLQLLERREPQPKVVFIARPQHVDSIAAATAAVWLGHPTADDHLAVRGLSSIDLAALIQRPPFELQYQGMVRAIVALAEGNPLVAILAARLARDGQGVAELSRASVFEQHVASVLGSLTGPSPESRQLRELLAIVAALGSLNSEDAQLVGAVAGLIGFAPRAITRWLAELADLGLATETDEGIYAIKPDLLAEHVLASSFFSARWRAQLPYAELLDALPLNKLTMVIGRLSPGLLDRTHPAAREFRNHLLARIADVDSACGAELLKQALPGAEDLLLDDFAEFINKLEANADAPTLKTVKPLVAATQRISQIEHLHLGWLLLLRIASLCTEEDALAEVRSTMRAIYQRVPTDTSAHDGRILSVVQQAIAQATRSYARRATASGQQRALAMAGQALLTVTFEETHHSLDTARQLDMRAYALPASADLKTVLTIGIDALIATFNSINDVERLRGLRSAAELSRRAAGVSGPFGLQLDTTARETAHEALEKLDAFLHENLDTFSMPIQAEAVTYILWRRDWRAPQAAPLTDKPALPPAPSQSSRLREYIFLIHPKDVEPPTAHYSWEEEQRRKQVQSAKLARSLAGDPDWAERLERWRSWYEQAAVLYDDKAPRSTLARTIAELTDTDSARAVEVADYLIHSSSPLREALATALHHLVARASVDDETLTAWLEHDEQTRALAASAIADVDTSLAIRLFRRLASDPSELVRRAALNGLRYGTNSAEWKIELGLTIARDLSDLDALLSVLLLAETANLTLTPQLVALAHEAFLATAKRGRLRDHQLLETLRLLDPAEPQLTFAWIWRRIDWLACQTERAWSIDVLPRGLAPLARELGSSAQLHEALQRFDSANRSSLAQEALAELLEWLDPGAAELTDYIARHYGDPDYDQKVWRLLRLTLEWDDRRARAVALAQTLNDPEPVIGLIENALPDMWSGSRVPHLQAALQKLDNWHIDQAQSVLRAAVIEARDFLQHQLERERKRNQRDDDLMRRA